MRQARDLDGYDAFVIGSAAYLGHWLREAVEFVRRNQTVLSARPVWLFSSGPLGMEATDAQGRDLREAAEPKEIAELKEVLHPRDHRVFFGVLDPRTRSAPGPRFTLAQPSGAGGPPQGGPDGPEPEVRGVRVWRWPPGREGAGRNGKERSGDV